MILSGVYFPPSVVLLLIATVVAAGTIFLVKASLDTGFGKKALLEAFTGAGIQSAVIVLLLAAGA